MSSTKAAATSSPTRTCAGCGAKDAQSRLRRFHARAGELVPGPGPGRGVYTCPRLACFERARARRGFNRTLHATVQVSPSLAHLYT